MKKFSILLVIVLLILTSLITSFNFAHAASITSVTDVLSRSKASTLSNHTITFTTPTGVAAGETIVITFPTDFIGEASIDYTDVDMYATTERTLAAVADGATWGAVFSDSGGTRNRLTLTSATGTVTAGGVVIIEIGTNALEGTTGNKQITNATTAGSFVVTVAAGSVDSGSYALGITTQDQVSISSSVDPYLEFAVTDATVALGTLSRTSVKTDTAVMTAITNSASGYNITASGATLTHTVNGALTITAIGGTHAASSTGNEQFGFRIAASGGSGASVDPYNDVAEYAYDGVTVPDQVATSAGVSDTTTYTITYMANISNLTESGSYTTTHTFICTGNF